MTETRHKRGDVREDGMVFEDYNPTCRGGERWLTKEAFEARREAKRLRKNERYAQDPDFRSRVIASQTKYFSSPDTKRRVNERAKQRRENNPLYALTVRLRNRTANAISRAGYAKDSFTAELIGCNFEEFKSHIEAQFTEGICWDNFGEWHIDHVTPLASATNEEELKKLFHYTNQQPLWAKDNLSKGAKILN